MALMLVVVAWLYVVLMMAAAEALSTQGSLLGALITFFAYGVLPLVIVVYVMGAPARRRARAAREAADAEQTRHSTESADRDGCSHAPGGTVPSVAPEREEG